MAPKGNKGLQANKSGEQTTPALAISALNKAAEIENLIAELCIKAPTDDIKFCLRSYESGKRSKQIEKDIYKFKLKVLVETSQYLRIPHCENKNKTQLSHSILCRIQNLLPDDCGICHNRYSVKLEQTSSLECSICGQGVHEECWSKLLTQAPSTSGTACDTTNQVKACLNPFNLPGIFYLCPACTENNIPLEDSTRSKKKTSSRQPEQPEVETEPESDSTSSKKTAAATPSSTPETEQEVDASVLTNPSEAEQTDNCNIAASSSVSEDHTEPIDLPVDIQDPLGKLDTMTLQETRASNAESSHDSSAEKGSQHKSETTCRYFRRGTCKHGIRGDDCRFSHPQMCRKFLQHGTRQPNGCKLGKKCKQFHPLMCMDSLKKSECLNDQCTYHHIKGTRRQPKVAKNNQNPQTPSTVPKEPTEAEKLPESNNQTGNFLEALRLLKAEILATMNNQISTLASQIQQVQTQWTPRQPQTLFHQTHTIQPNHYPINLFNPAIVPRQLTPANRTPTPIQN